MVAGGPRAEDNIREFKADMAQEWQWRLDNVDDNKVDKCKD